MKNPKSRHPDYSDVRRIALALANTEEGLSYGAPAIKVGGQLFVRFREELDSIVVRVDPDQREAMMATEPEVYYITDHYLNYPYVLARLAKIDIDALSDLLRMSWKIAARVKKPQQARSKRSRT